MTTFHSEFLFFFKQLYHAIKNDVNDVKEKYAGLLTGFWEWEITVASNYSLTDDGVKRVGISIFISKSHT